MKTCILVPILGLLSITSVAAGTTTIPPEARRAIKLYESHQKRVAAKQERVPGWRSGRAKAATNWAPAPEDLLFDVSHYTLRLFVDIDREVISGSVELELSILEDGIGELRLDADANLQVSGVSLLGNSQSHFDAARSLNYLHRENQLLISFPQPLIQGQQLRLLISYGGHASRGGDGINWDYHGASKPLVWTMAEPFGARVWWPCQDRPDDKALVDLWVTTDARYKVASNGLELFRTELPEENLAESHWASSYEVASYLVAMNISDFDYSELQYEALDASTMPVVLYALPEFAAQAKQDLARTPEMIGVLAQYYGEYPFVDEKYGNCSTTLGGGMEHQTLTTFGVDSIGSDFMQWLDVHELGHQWWGDWLTCADWRELWLNEGFATYTEWLWAEYQGEELLQDYLKDTDPLGLFFGPVYDNPVAFSNTVYNKGGWVLRMLRHRLGDQLFWTAMRAYRASEGGNTGLSSELQAAFEEASGQDLAFFFDQWVYGENRPKIVFDWEMAGSNELQLHLRQIQTNADPFRFLLDLDAEIVGGGRQRKQLEVQALREQTISIPVDGPISALSLDPENQTLAEFSSLNEPVIDLGSDYPGPYDLGISRVGSGESLAQSIPITNVGNAPLTILGIGFYYGNVPDFSADLPGRLPLSIEAGESIDMELSFHAIGMGSRDNWLWIASDDPHHGGITYVKVHARAGFYEGPRLQAPSHLAFSSVPAGGLNDRNLKLVNLGDELLQVSILVEGDAFLLAGASELELEPGASSSLGIVFRPSTVGEHQGRVRLQSNDPEHPSVEVPLSGLAGAGPRAEVIPPMVDFGVDTAGAVADFRINSVGMENLHLQALDFEGPFQLADVLVLPSEIPAGSSLSLPLRVRSDASGSLRGVLRILSDDPTLPWLSVPLNAVVSAAEEIQEDSIVAVAHTTGFGDALWKTDLTLLNPGGEDRAVEIEFLPETGRGGGSERLTRTLVSGAAMTVEDLVGRLGKSGVGGLRLKFDKSPALVHSRTAAWDPSGASYGQTIDGNPASAALGVGEVGVLAGLASGEGFHSNIEILNLGQEPIVVDFHFYDPEGIDLGRISLSAQGQNFAQRTGVLKNLGPIRGAWASVSSDSPGAHYSAFASMIDDISHDPTSIPLQTLTGLEGEFVIPVVATGPGFNYSRWGTTMSLVNPGPGDAEIQAVYHAADASKEITVNWDLKAGTSLYSSDVLQELFGSGGAGWLKILSSLPLATNLRIYNTNMHGTYGQNVEINAGAGCGGKRLFSGLRSDGGFRCNLGLTSIDGVDRMIGIRVFSEDGKEIGRTSVALPAKQFVQEVEFLKNLFDFRGRAWLEVEAEDPEACFIAHVSMVDGLSGDPSYLPGWKIATP